MIGYLMLVVAATFVVVSVAALVLDAASIPPQAQSCEPVGPFVICEDR